MSKTVEELARECADRGNYPEGCEEWQDRYDCFTAGYNAAKPRWVKCSERWPTKDGNYLFKLKYPTGEVLELRYFLSSVNGHHVDYYVAWLDNLSLEEE